MSKTFGIVEIVYKQQEESHQFFFAFTLFVARY